ncbi:MAG: DUF721 domain-containing protein [Candidatus Moraniibacteriota bacterium]
MHNLSDLLRKKRKINTRETAPDEQTILFLFSRVLKGAFGEQGAQKILAKRFSEGALYLQSPSSLWRTEIMLQKENLLANLNSELGEEVVKDIKISFS